MRSNLLAALLTTATLAVTACAGEPQAPLTPPPPPAPVETAAVAPPPSGLTPPAPPPKPPLADLIESSLTATREGFNAHDPAKMATAVTDDVAVFDYGHGETHSKADFQNGMAQLFSFVGDAKFAPSRVWKKGDVVILELTWAGTMTGDVMGMKATHKPVGQVRLHVCWFNDDGLIKELHEYADDAGLMAQMQNKKGAPPVPMLPTNPPEVHVAAGTPEQDKLGDWAKGMDDAFNKDDAKAVVAGLADDADYWLNTTGMPATRGKKDLAKELQASSKRSRTRSGRRPTPGASTVSASSSTACPAPSRARSDRCAPTGRRSPPGTGSTSRSRPPTASFSMAGATPTPWSCWRRPAPFP